MRILDRYILKELLGPFFFGICLFASILVGTGPLFRIAQYISQYGASLWTCVKLLVYSLPAIIALTFPMAMLLASLMAFGRLSSSSEIVAMKCGGLSFYRLATPVFLVAQTLVVGVWIVLNTAGVFHFDIYPFILLNLAFSLQAAYAAPLILLAQTRQADRDKALADADAQHREALALASKQREEHAAEQTGLLLELMRQNTELTETTRSLSLRIQTLTEEVHRHIIATG